MPAALHEWWRLPATGPTALYSPEHVGLYLSRCLPELPTPADAQRLTQAEEAQQAGKAHRVQLYAAAIAALRPRVNSPGMQTYRACFGRWRARLANPGPLRAVRVVELVATSRLLLHPASNQSVTDGAVLMHHTYGAPYLPGSGLKGVARAWGRAQGVAGLTELLGFEREDPDAGGQNQGGQNQGGQNQGGQEPAPRPAALVNFLDALWVPEAPAGEPADWSPLCLDVVTPHHGGYYTGEGPPADWEQPVPTQRLAVSPGARFCVLLEGALAPRELLEEWLALAERLLIGGVQELGFGAYTGAGFGRMKAVRPGGAGVGAAPSAPGAWLLAKVSRVKGAPKLSARLDGQVVPARLEGPEVQRLLDGLPPETRDRLHKQGELRLEVQVEPLGPTLRIVGLRPVGLGG